MGRGSSKGSTSNSRTIGTSSSIGAPSGSRSKGGTQDAAQQLAKGTHNSRVYGLNSGISKGQLGTQRDLRRWDMETTLVQMAAFSSKNKGASGDKEYRAFAAKSNRNLRETYNKASESTKNQWAMQVKDFNGGKNPVTRRIAKDLNRRYERIQQAKNEGRKRLKSRRRGNKPNESSDLNSLFGF